MLPLPINTLIHGIVEGVTEFLPISSTGHLILLNEIEALRLPEDFADSFDIVVQFGAIAATVIYFWRDLFPWGAGKTAEEGKSTFRLWLHIIIASFPALLLGYFFKDMIKEHLFDTRVIASTLFLGGIAMILLERQRRAPRVSEESGLNWRDALLIGCFQCLAMVPGTSRSAATIIGALAIGFSRPLAARFSFFLAIPTLTAAAGYELLTVGHGFSGAEYVALGVGMAAAFVVSWLVIAGLMRFIQRHDFRAFGWYRIALAIVVFALLAAGVIGKI